MNLLIVFTVSCRFGKSPGRSLERRKNGYVTVTGMQSKSIQIIESHGIERANSCSKYSLGVIYSGLAEKWSKFQETMDKIAAIRMEVVKEKRKESFSYQRSDRRW